MSFCPSRSLIAGFLFAAMFRLQAETLTYPDLVHRLTDMEHLATLPPDGEAGGLASSYDRASQYDAAKDQYLNWGANDDGHGVIREEGDGQVLADLKGPGCIWRIWSAQPQQGHVRIYLDGASTPAVDLPFESYFSKRGPFAAWKNLVYTHASGLGTDMPPGTYLCNGNNCYVPIPFQKSCKIVGDKGTGKPDDETRWGVYFHFSYGLFAPGTVVPTFQLPLSEENSAALAQANERLAHCGDDPAPHPNQKDQKQTVTVAPGQISTALEITGAGAITLLKIKTALPEYAEAQRTLLRQLTIRMTWDGAQEPAVGSPLGDFFGYLGGAGSFSTAATGLLDDGTFYSHWYMPFATSARIELGNDSPSPVSFEVETAVAPLEAPLAGLGRFHAKWHRDIFNPERQDRVPDWTLVKTQGRGRFVGTMLHVWNPDGGWWGEGDEKFFVDGEKFPSYFGTGSEDYFGYAWGNPGRFIRPFHAQPLNENNNGHVDDIRWLIADNVPFHTSFAGCLEKYFPNVPAQPFGIAALYATESCWYLSADGTDPYGEVPVGQRLGYWTRTASYREPDAIEAESMETAKWPRSPTQIECMHGPGTLSVPGSKAGVWSGDMQMAWDPQGLHDELELKLPVPKPGRYQILVRPTRGPGYGIFQCGIDGQNLGAPLDLYAQELVAADPVPIGAIQLTAGDHIFNVTATGKNPALPGDQPVAGLALDYIKLVPLP